MPEGFQVQQLYEVPKEQGSWVSIAVDPKGRLITCDQYGKLYRTTLKDGVVQNVEPIDIPIGRAHGLLCAFDSLYVMAHAGEGKPAGLYRALDTNGDDKYDSVSMLRKIDGGGEHGPHAIILSPDKKSLYVCGGNHTNIPAPETSRVPRNWQEDQLLPRMWDAGGHAVGKLAPGGWICKTDPEGKSFELVSCGYRNEYDIAFAPDGALFTYDADMEWDVGLPWYRPTRMCHAVSGSEFGWRSGTGKWPTYYPDSLPPVLDIGPGSPTGIVFGTSAKFPAKYQNALFIADWSYGVIYAIHMQQDGATYKGEKEIFCTAPGLAVTDMVVNPTDGALYFMIGGRRSQSALYRIAYMGSESTETAVYPAANELNQLRRSLEELHTPDADTAKSLDMAWPNLSHKDRFVRYAARMAIEHQSVSKWIDRAMQATDTQEILELGMAVARCAPRDPDVESKLIEKLGGLDWESLSMEQKLNLLRDYGLVMIRLGASEETTKAIQERFSSLYPSNDKFLNRELSRLLIAAQDPSVAEKTMSLLTKAPTQEEQIHYVLSLRTLKAGWTKELRTAYFEWFLDAARFKGGNSFARFLQNIRNEAVEQLPEADRASMAQLLNQPIEQKDPYADLKARPFVKKWTLDELVPVADKDLANRDLKNGKEMFAVGQCYKCHRMSGEGGIVGPDLTAAGRRFSAADLMETLIDPSKEVSDQYRATKFQLDTGQTVIGRIANLNADTYMVQTDMLDPGRFTRIKVNQIEAMKESEVSMMPTGLLDSMTRDDILDLLAYMRKEGELEVEK
jgi:putative heme-binding domain-containing protein